MSGHADNNDPPHNPADPRDDAQPPTTQPPTTQSPTASPQHADAERDDTVLAPQFDAAQVVGCDGTPRHPHQHQRAITNALDLPAELFPGALPAGCQIDDFRIITPLGQGAFASVYLAQQVSMQRLVALKISTGLAHDGSEAEESQTLARLDHPGIVRVFDQRRLPGRDAHLLYMQYLPGGTLAGVVTRVREHQRLASSSDRADVPHRPLDGQVLLASVDEQLLRASQQVPEHSELRQWIGSAPWPVVVAWVGVQLAHALHAAHQQGVFHRDVKPANVLLSAEGKPRLADFNVSFSTPVATAIGPAESGPAATREMNRESVDSASCSIGGSIAYMAPEQLCAVANAMCDEAPVSAARLDIGATADVYATGVLLWELWQGQRPFEDEPLPMRSRGWFERQANRRRQPPKLTSPPTNPASARGNRLPRAAASQRVLEQVLRQAIQFEPQRRPQTAGELAAKLRLALHPDAARLFDPSDDSWLGRCGKISVWLIAAAIILLPNIAAGCFNYFYNYIEIIGRYPELKPRFFVLASTVNSIAFPLGAVLMVVVANPVAKAIKLARAHGRVEQLAISQTVGLGRRAAWIGGVLWVISACVFSVVLATGSPRLPAAAALHFFGSLLICGGVAAVYPFFGLIVITTCVYYPCLVRQGMHDEHFDRRHAAVRRWCGHFLLAAAGIPLLGLTLLLSRETMDRHVVASAVAATAIGLVAAYAAFQSVHTNWETMSEVLSNRKQSVGTSSIERID